MAILDPINIGAAANDGTGNKARDAYNKSNLNDQALNDDIGINTNALARIKTATTATLSASASTDITFSTAFASNDYSLVLSGVDANGFTVPLRLVSKSTTKFTVEIFQDTIITYIAIKK